LDRIGQIREDRIKLSSSLSSTSLALLRANYGVITSSSFLFLPFSPLIQSLKSSISSSLHLFTHTSLHSSRTRHSSFFAPLDIKDEDEDDDDDDEEDDEEDVRTDSSNSLALAILHKVSIINLLSEQRLTVVTCITIISRQMSFALIKRYIPRSPFSPQIIAAMLSMDMITPQEASVLLEMARSGNEYVTAAFELYQAGTNTTAGALR
jgi:hypothetical protein